MRVAVVDLGSNSFHLAVFDPAVFDAGLGSMRVVARQKELLGLGAVVARFGHIPPDDAARSTVALGRLVTAARESGAETLIVAATAALRDAANGEDVVMAMERATGVSVRVLSGHEEAHLVFSSVAHRRPADAGPLVCLDLGGGSLEVAAGRGLVPEVLASTGLGASQLTARFVASDPPTPAEMAAVSHRAASRLGPIGAGLAHLGAAQGVVSGGIARDLARLVAARRSVPTTWSEVALTAAELNRLAGELARCTTAARIALPGISVARAAGAPVGAAVLAAAVEHLGLGWLTVGRFGVREGLVLEHLGLSAPLLVA
ncbi:MAG: Ppx/GppA phosphatase family protein [Acidimicrobiales bacterium]